MRKSFEAIIFDCDGVLVDSETLAIKGERLALGEMGLDYAPADYVRRFVGLRDDAFFDILRRDFADRFLRQPPDDFENRILAGRRRERDALKIVEGADLALTAAARFGAVAVASSSQTNFLESKLRRTGLWDLVAPHVYSADIVARGKPEPDIFLYTAARLGVDPMRCLVVEDSENGVRAGVAAGMSVIGFVGGGHCYPGHDARLAAAGATWIAPDFKALLSTLAA